MATESVLKVKKMSGRARATLSVAIALVLSLSGLVVVAPAHAATTYVVTSTADSGAGTLREAITLANGNANPLESDVISFSLALPATITLLSELPPITESLNIEGPTTGIVTVTTSTAVNEGFVAVASCPPTVQQLTISNLTVTGFEFDGIRTDCVDLTLTDVISTNNGESGADAQAGIITITDSEFSANDSSGLNLFSYGFDFPEMTLDGITANNNGAEGIRLRVIFAITVTASGITATGNDGDGMFLEALDASTVFVLDSTASNNGGNGLAIIAKAGALVRVSDTSADNNGPGLGSDGVDADVSRAELELSGVTVDGNARSGVAVVQSDGATVKLGGVTATDSPAGGVFELSPAPGASSGLLTIDASEFRQNPESGIELESDAGDVVITGTTFAENGIGSASNGGGLEVILTGASNLAVRDSVVEDNEGANGAGLWALLFGSSTLSTEGTVIARNTATGDGGAIFLDTVSGPAGLVSIADSDITENDATRGAGVFVRSLGDGAVTAGLRIIRSTISDNIASGPGGGLHLNDWSWAAAASTPVISIAQSTFSGNEAAAGAGIYAAKADIVDGEPGLMRLINSTISGNTSLGLGGGLWFTPESADGLLEILHSTVVGNVGSGTGDGVYVGPLAPFELSHTIVANNGTEDLRIDGLTPDYSSSWSLIETAVVTVGAFVSGPGDIVGLDPQLAALADNGGPTFTHRPLAGSRVIDAGNPSIVGAPPTDQRGDPRISRVIDIGAVEVQQTALAATGSDQAGAVLAGLVLVIAGSVLLVTRRRLTGAPSWARSRG